MESLGLLWRTEVGKQQTEDVRTLSRPVVLATTCRGRRFFPTAVCSSSLGAESLDGRAALGLESSWIVLAEAQGYKAVEDVLLPGMNDLNFPRSPFPHKPGKEVKPEKGSQTWKNL